MEDFQLLETPGLSSKKRLAHMDPLTKVTKKDVIELYLSREKTSDIEQIGTKRT